MGLACRGPKWPALQCWGWESSSQAATPDPASFASLTQPLLQPLGHAQVQGAFGGVQMLWPPWSLSPCFLPLSYTNRQGLCVCETAGAGGGGWKRVTMGLSLLNQNISENRDGWLQGSNRGKRLTEDVWVPTYVYLRVHCHLAQGPV